MVEQTIHKQLDEDWLNLMKEAKHLGLTIEEIKDFIEKRDGSNHPHSET